MSHCDLDQDSQAGYQSMRENQLRNELIRQKQQYITLSNKLLIYADDQKKSSETQAIIDQVSLEIEKIELELKSSRRNADLLEKLKQFKPGNVMIQSKLY